MDEFKETPLTPETASGLSNRFASDIQNRIEKQGTQIFGRPNVNSPILPDPEGTEAAMKKGILSAAGTSN